MKINNDDLNEKGVKPFPKVFSGLQSVKAAIVSNNSKLDNKTP